MQSTPFDIKAATAQYCSELIELRRDIHAHPELGLKEYRTAQLIEDYLTQLEIPVRRYIGTGVVGILKGRHPGATVMLRSDIDALPIEEQTGLPFASQNPGVMHACGHDGHTAIQLVTAKILAEYRERLAGTVVFLFQPNEEDAGAQLMIDAGVMKDTRPEAVFGLHVWPRMPSGTVGITEGPLMASAYYFKIVIKGKGGHGGHPDRAINPINAAAHVLQSIQTMLTAEIDATQPTIISTCKIHAGEKEIIIPEVLEMEGSIRCLHENDESVRVRLRELVEEVCQAHRCTCEISFKCGNTLVNNDPNLAGMAVAVAEELLGKENINCSRNCMTMGGDDFAEFMREIPGLYYFVGSADPSKKTDTENHNPRFLLDEGILHIGVEMQLGLVLKYLTHRQHEALPPIQEEPK